MCKVFKRRVVKMQGTIPSKERSFRTASARLVTKKIIDNSGEHDCIAITLKFRTCQIFAVIILNF